jgi:hypothetical protein
MNALPSCTKVLVRPAPYLCRLPLGPMCQLDNAVAGEPMRHAARARRTQRRERKRPPANRGPFLAIDCEPIALASIL